MSILAKIKPSKGGLVLWATGIASMLLAACALTKTTGERNMLIASTLAGVGATTLGFVLTAVTILAALSNTRLVGKMYQTGHAKVLFDELFGAVLIFLLVTVCAVAFVAAESSIGISALGLAITYFLLGTVVLGIAGHKFYRVVLTIGKAPTSAATS
jgi:hypothetical protein